MTNEITVRLFQPDEWALYKAIRLRALQADPDVFGSGYNEMAVKPDIYWQERLKNPEHGLFGIFHGKTLIGMTGVYIEDKTSQAWLGSSWLEKEWRNKGLSARLFEARVKWAQQHPALKSMLVAHRERNISSKKAILKYGFQFDRTDDMTWPDGTTEPEFIYKLKLGA